MQSPQPRSLVISKGLILTDAGLISAAGPVVLGQREQFKELVLSTSAPVIHSLSLVFPDAVAIPLADGTAQSSDMAAWEHYNQQVLLLRSGRLGIDETIQVGRVVLQWCQAAVIAAQVEALQARRAPEFLAVEYLAYNGAKALACSPAQWEAYVNWVKDENTLAAVQRSMEGYGRRDPRPSEVSVVAPWPEYLGAVKEGGGTLIDKVVSVASDILIGGDRTFLRVGGFVVKARLGPELVAAFEASGPESWEDHLDRVVMFKTATGSYTFRVQRSMAESGDYQYAFRLLATDSANKGVPLHSECIPHTLPTLPVSGALPAGLY
jgi:hypothetical protein